MEVILDDLKQYDLKRINDIENISFKYEFTLRDKYYLYAQFHHNIIILLNIVRQVSKYNMHRILQNINTHSYEIEHNFEMHNIYDIFYNFCLNNFVNSTTQIKQLQFYLYTINKVKQVIIRDIRNYSSDFTKIITISNLNELDLFYNAINKCEKSTAINIIFEQN